MKNFPLFYYLVHISHQAPGTVLPSVKWLEHKADRTVDEVYDV